MKLRLLFLFLPLWLCTQAQEFETWFCDSTLRVDYIFGGNAQAPVILEHGQSKHPGWHGRRAHLAEVPFDGSGQINVIDEASGDTIYRHPFSSLFQEWLSTDEAAIENRAFENTYLIPLPRQASKIDVALYDNHRDVIARLVHRYDPANPNVRVGGRGVSTPHVVISEAEDSTSPIHVAIVAEGYTQAQMPAFYTKAREVVDALASHEPFASNLHRFTFVAVGAESEQSGASDPNSGQWRSTALGSHFNTFYSDRYLTVPEVFRLHDLLEGIPYEHIIIVANTEKYGGGGIYNSYTMVSANDPNFRPVVVHEFGHSFGGLADEYFYDGDVMEDSYPLDVEPWEPNITTRVDFAAKWEDIIDQPGVGLFEGGGYTAKGVYRPADNCRMRTNTAPAFCPVCQRAILHVILSHY
ncbi:MAG: IgA Peptidase M64 [Bacteroidales bacterium]|nr:IgA Peptidase M64 [Bacteroidales bacterium]